MSWQAPTTKRRAGFTEDRLKAKTNFGAKMSQPFVFVALPSRPGDTIAAGLLTATHSAGKGFAAEFRSRSLSLLTTNFNSLWCDALNARKELGITHFCMIHADVVPEPGWLEKLIQEMGRVGADVLSCCIPLKDDRGLTSTGLMDPDTRRMRKLSVKETLDLPLSFNARDADLSLGQERDSVLLLNTGLWICDFTKLWVEKIVFRQYDTIVKQADGRFRPASVSEDWLWSIDLHRLGLRTYATTAVKIKHVGHFDYPNFVAWGTQERGEENGQAAVAWNINPPESWGCPPEPVGYPTADFMEPLVR